MASAPQLGQIQHSAVPNQITANWTSAGAGTFRLALFKDYGTTPIQFSDWPAGFGILASPPLNETSVFTVAVAQLDGGVAGPYGNPVQVIVGPPRDLQVEYDGEAIALRWTVPAGATVATGAEITLRNSGGIVDNIEVDGTRTVWLRDSPLDPNVSYTITVAGMVNSSVGPQSSEIPIIQAVLKLAQLTYTVFEGTGGITANNSTPPPVTNPPLQLEAQLFADQTLLAAATGSSALVVISSGLLGPWSFYTVRIGYVTTGSRGPWSSTLPVLVQPAKITSVDYDGTHLSATWSWVAGEPPPAGANITILDSNGTPVASADAIGTSLQFTPDPQLTPNANYTVTALATRGASIGTVSAAVPVLTFQVAPASTTYDGAILTATWNNTSLTGVTRMLLHLLMGGQIVQSQLVAGGSGTMRTVLSPNGQYQVALQTLGDNTSGPLGDTRAVIASAPEITATQYTAAGANSKVRVEWNAAGQSIDGVASWSVQLWQDGIAWQAPVTVAVGTLAAEVLPGSALDASKTYAATVRGINGTAQLGPLSAAAPVLPFATPIVSASYDGANVSLAWAAAGGNAGYIARLTDNDNTQVGSTIVTGGTEAVIPLPSAPRPTYHALVHPFSAMAKGPESSLGLLTNSVAVSATSYDGAILHVTWPALSGATSYLVQLRNGDETIFEQAASGTSCDIEVVLAATGTYSVAVRGVGANVVGPPSTAKPILAGRPSIQAITATASSVKVTWNAAPGGSIVTGYIATLEAPGLPPITASGTDSATFTPASLDSWRAYTVRVQAIGTGLTGPSTAPVPVIVGVPGVQSIQFDGSHVVLRWDALNAVAVTGYIAQIVDGDGNKVGDPVNTKATHVTLPLKPVPGKTYGVVLQATDGMATGPSSAAAAAPVILAKPTISGVAYDGADVTVAIGAVADTNVTGYIARLYLDGVVVAAEKVDDRATTTIRVRAALSASGAYDVAVVAVGTTSEGQESAKVAAIAPVPQVTGSTVTPSQITVTWNALEIQNAHGVTGYSVQLWENGVKKGAPVIRDKSTGRADIPVSGGLQAWKRYSVTVQATGVSSTGTLSIAAGVIASIPSILSATISGFGWSLSWTAAGEDFVTGYHVTVTDAQGGNAQPFDTAHTALALPNDFKNNQSLATVYAVGAGAAGQASAAANLYGRGASYYFSATGNSAPAYLFRASSQPAGASAIKLYLPDLFNNTPSIQNAVFALTKPATSSSYPYLITIAQDSVAWQFTGPARVTLWNAYLQFLTDLDVLVNSQPQLKPGAFNLITQVLGRALPLLFGEQLSYVYRFNAPGGYIDLVPGMRLRIDSEARQYSGPPSPTNVNINGFVSSGTSVFDLGQYWQGAQINTGFNSYLSLSGRPVVPGTNATGGAAGGLDLYPALNRMPLFRLLYPGEFPASNSNGFADLTDNILIIGANRFGDLQGATTQYVANGNFSGYESKISQTWFRGRAVLTPEIPILLNGALEYVAVGTTLRQLLGLFGGGAYPAGSYAGGLTFRRVINNIVDDISVATPPEALRTNDVRIDVLPLNVYGDGSDALDLSVIQGDSFTFVGAVS
jgi:Fibronectin type III domain